MIRLMKVVFVVLVNLERVFWGKGGVWVVVILWVGEEWEEISIWFFV